MIFSRRIKLLGLWAILTLKCVQAFPASTKGSPPKQARQEDEDDAATVAPVVFGTHVAQIITGALTGNIDSIIKGSFGFIQQPEVNQLSHNTWETLKGNPTVRPAFAPEVTTQSAPEPLPAPAATEPPAPKPEEAAAESFPSSGSGSVVFTPTVRATQPTAATLAPLQVFEGLAGGTEKDVEAEQSTSASASAASTTKDVDDEDEDAESGEELKESSTAAQAANAIVPETSTSEAVTQAAATEDTDQDSESTTGGTSGGDSDAETTTEEDDQDQLDNENSLYG